MILLPTILGPFILFGISLVLPSKYRSETLVIIQRQKIPNALVQPIITDDLNARVASLEEQVLSRTRLEPLIKRYDVFKGDADQPTEVLVDRLRKSIELTPVKPIVRSRDETLPGFTIGVTLSTAPVAQHVCAEITSMFVEEDLRQREQSSQGATSFFASQLDEAKRHLDEEDAKLAQFKRQNFNELPDSGAANLNLLTTLNGQFEAATQALSRAQQDKTYTESLLAQQVATWKALQDGGFEKPQPQTLEQQLTVMQTNLAELETQYTPDHPDIVRLKADIAQLKKKIQDAKAAPTTKDEATIAKPSLGEPPQIQQLRSQLRAYDEAIRNQTKEQQRLQAQIQSIQSRIQMTPVVEQQYKEITRDHQMAQDFYNELLKKKNESAMATDLEQRQQGEQFVVMDPANMPEEPSFPNRPLFALGGLGGGLGLGLALAWLMEMRDKTLYTDKDVEACLGLPTLARVPTLFSGDKKQKLQVSRDSNLSLSEAGSKGI
ncbi:MAG TPA: lipopolysaccharide biosynthesis protein [Terriglobia bacterium]|nr:lipopolysaccharide biosynthesis protein [Terriglobia bacterium]